MKNRINKMFKVLFLYSLIYVMGCSEPSPYEPYTYTKKYWNIHTMNVDGSNIKNLSNIEEYIWLSGISPKGTKIIYLINNCSYTMNFDGGDKRLICNSGMQYSPDENKILYNKYTMQGYDIYIMNSDGSNSICLTDRDGYNIGARFSPDGLKIVYTSNGSIYTMNIDGSSNTFLTSGIVPQYSPDGSKILYYFNNDFFAMSSDGTNITNITNGSRVGLGFTISPDGLKIGFGYWDANTSYIAIMDIDGKNRKTLTEYLPFMGSGKIIFSYDGSKIIYCSLTNGIYNLYVIGIDGSNKKNLTTHISEDCIAPIFTKNGDRIVFQKLTEVQKK